MQQSPVGCAPQAAQSSAPFSVERKLPLGQPPPPATQLPADGRSEGGRRFRLQGFRSDPTWKGEGALKSESGASSHRRPAVPRSRRCLGRGVFPPPPGGPTPTRDTADGGQERIFPERAGEGCEASAAGSQSPKGCLSGAA